MATVLAAVEAGSLSAASRKLGVPLATVSRRVSDLEDHLGTQLLIRTSRRLELTDAGRSYIIACRRILADIDEAERVAAGEYSAPQGELTVTASIVFGRLHALPVTADFLRAYPDVTVRLLLADRVVNMVEERVDIAIRIGDLPDSGLTASRIGSIHRVVCASPAYCAERGAPQTPDELINHDCITFDGLNAADAWTFDMGKTAMSFPIRSRLIVSTAEAAIDAAIASIGVTRVLSYQMADAASTGKLQVLLRDYEPQPLPVHLVHASQPLLPLKLRAFLDFARPRLKARLAAAAAKRDT